MAAAREATSLRAQRMHRRIRRATNVLLRGIVLGAVAIFVLWNVQGRWPQVYPPLLVLAVAWWVCIPVALLGMIAEAITRRRIARRGGRRPARHEDARPARRPARGGAR